MGKLIVFEGLDCSFKETVSNNLYKTLKDLNKKVAIFSFPQYSEESSVLVRSYLAGHFGPLKKMDPYVISVAYMVDIFYTWLIKIKPLYDDGYTIILDRYWYCNIYYQGCKYKFNSEEYCTLKKDLTTLADKMGLPVPDATFYMRQPVDTILRLTREKNSANDIIEASSDYMKSVYNIYDQYLDELDLFGSIKIIDCAKNDVLSRNKLDLLMDVATKLATKMGPNDILNKNDLDDIIRMES